MIPSERPELLAEGGELRRRGEAVSHQLNLIEYPQAVVVQQPEVHRPAEAAHRVAAVERAREQHILRADEHTFAFGLSVPTVPHVAAHQRVHREALLQTEPLYRLLRHSLRLLDESPHRQAVNQTTAYARLRLQPAPEPRTEHGGRFTRPRWGIEERWQGVCLGQPPLIVEGTAPVEGGAEEVVKVGVQVSRHTFLSREGSPSFIKTLRAVRGSA